MSKKILYILLFLLLIGVGTGIYVWVFIWNKKEVKAEQVKGVTIGAADLSKEYNANEKKADSTYLNKVIEVSGTVSEIDTNQGGTLMVVLQGGEAGVQCTMRDAGVVVSKGQNITIKGFCSGNSITGVSLTRCVINK